MSENRKEIAIHAGRDESTACARREWRRPEWRMTDAREAEAGLNINPDINLAS